MYTDVYIINIGITLINFYVYQTLMEKKKYDFKGEIKVK